MIGTTTVESVIRGIGTSLADSSGGTSQMRLGMFLWTLVLCGGVAWIVYTTKAFPDLPYPIVEITGGWIFGKVWQKGQELKGIDQPVASNPPARPAQ